MNYPNGMVPYNNQLVYNQNMVDGQQHDEQRFAQPFGQQQYGQPYYPPFQPRCRWVRECRWVFRCFPRDQYSPYDYGGGSF
ncbi:hypothetical protein [Bacillus sp. JCM 19034]|uniref:hypothetical protein n=1 Tax=Bacillus sp. JCM 19034 TaxID=1481928 RepID=UPI0007833388|nr:hypothetical protein [Bacillus sp. JCM 19034]